MSTVTLTLTPFQAMQLQSALSDRLLKLRGLPTAPETPEREIVQLASEATSLALVSLASALYLDAPESADPITAAKAYADWAPGELVEAFGR